MLDQEVSALAGIGVELTGVVAFLARDLARAGRLFRGSSIWLIRDEFMHAIVTRMVEKTIQAVTIPTITTVMASSFVASSSIHQIEAWLKPNCLSLCWQYHRHARFKPRQSGDHAVLNPFRSVTLRPSLSTGLPFLCCTRIIRFVIDAFNSIYILINVYFQAL
jgi:hypothetical protein